MGKAQHTPEPWDSRGHSEKCGLPILETMTAGRIATFSRIVDRDRAQACVNAFAGINDPAVFVAAARQLVERLEYEALPNGRPMLAAYIAAFRAADKPASSPAAQPGSEVGNG